MRFIFSCHLPRRQQPCTSCLAFWQCQARDEGVEKGFWCHAKQVSDEAWGLLEIAEILIAEMGRACARREGVWSFAFLVRALLLLFLIGLTDIFQSRNQNVSNHLRQSICSQCPHSTVHTQHYSNPASFQETRSSWEANIYLHSLTLLSDCLILLSDSPLLFHCPPHNKSHPNSAAKHLVQKDMTSSEDLFCVVLMMQRARSFISGNSQDMFAHPTLRPSGPYFASLTNPPGTPTKVVSAFLPISPQSWELFPTPPLRCFVFAIITIIILSTSKTSSASLQEALSCLTLCYVSCMSSQFLLNSTDQCLLGTINQSS